MLTFYFIYPHNMCMKKFWTNLTQNKRMVLLAIAIGLFLSLLSLIGVFFNQIGWLIGVVLATIAEIIFLLIQSKSTEILLKENKAGIYILFFILRMLVVVSFGVVIVLFEFKFPQAFLKNSIFGYLIGVFPISIITILSTKKEE